MLVTIVVPAETYAQDQKQVLVLYASRPDAQISVLGESRLPRLLEAGLSERIDYYSEHIEVARFNDVVYLNALDDFLAAKYRDKRFDLVIAMHDLSLVFAASHRQRLFPDAPIVFFSEASGMSRPPNSVGAASRKAFGPTVDLAMTLQPDLQRLFLITGSDPRDAAYEREVRRQLEPFAGRLDIQYWSGLPTPELHRRLRTIPERSAVYYVLVNRDGDGEYFHPLQYFADIAPSANAPIYSWVDSTMGRGIVGGNLKTQERQVEVLSGIAVRVLRGESPDSIPLTEADVSVNQVDFRQLRKWNIDPSRVPSGTVVRFREPTFWEQYRWYALGALTLFLAQSALLSGLLLNRRRRRIAEEHTAGAQAELRTSYERIRALGARLLQAQESERAHIARELHDDISQQLALLSIDLQLVDWTGTPADGTVAGALDRVQKVARSVHELSHRLHPAKLRLIGLTAALHGLQRELSRSDVDVHLLCENVPASLPADVSLCVYRVVQEAMQNAIKHSRARHVWVRLNGSTDHLSLTITDDGVGFDVAAALGSGLGLVSMRERLEVVGSELTIHSAPGSGTRIHVDVSVAAETAAAARVV